MPRPVREGYENWADEWMNFEVGNRTILSGWLEKATTTLTEDERKAYKLIGLERALVEAKRLKDYNRIDYLKREVENLKR